MLGELIRELQEIEKEYGPTIEVVMSFYDTGEETEKDQWIFSVEVVKEPDEDSILAPPYVRLG